MAAEALLTTKRVEINDKNKLTAAALNADNKTFVIHIATLAKLTTMRIQPFYQAQVTVLISTEIRNFAEYSKFSDVFSLESAAKLPEYTGINDPPINLLDNKQLHYSPIYSLDLIELKLLKTYIEANLASSFISPYKSPSGTLILFV